VLAARFPENQYSHVVDLRGASQGNAAPTAASALYEQLRVAHGYLLAEEFALALDAYAELDRHVATLVDPAAAALSSTPQRPITPILIDAAARTLQALPAERPDIPPGATVSSTTQPFDRRRGRVSDPAGDDALVRVELARQAACRGDWRAARELYLTVREIARADTQMSGPVERDLGIVLERCGDRAGAIAALNQSVDAFAGEPADQYDALICLAGVHQRGGDARQSEQTIARAEALATKSGPFADEPSCATDRACCEPPVLVNATTLAQRVPSLRAADAIRRRPGTELVFGTGDGTQRISLTGDLRRGLEEFHAQREKLADPDLLDGQTFGPSVLVAYLPHVRSFVVPMAVGDCHVGMGDFDAAEQSYQSVLAYPSLHPIEVVKLWQRLADLYYARGESLYRAARRDRSQFPAAAEQYAKVVRADGSVDNHLPFYADARSADIARRVTDIAHAENAVAHDDNPAIKVRVMRPRQRLAQIAAGLDFFGFAS
jgi:tetratricopeptide (TPR) repeat protein